MTAPRRSRRATFVRPTPRCNAAALSRAAALGREAARSAVAPPRSDCEQSILTVDDLGNPPTGPNVPARIVFDFDEAGAGAALAQLRSEYAECTGEGPHSIFDATHFLGEPGAECLRNEDCMEGTRCEHPPRAVFGTCVIAPREGAACTDVCSSYTPVFSLVFRYVCVHAREESGARAADRPRCRRPSL